MKTLLVAIAVITCTLGLNAGQGKHKAARERKAAIKTELLAKYDANKDGKLRKAERANMSKLDKKRARHAGLHKKQARKHKATK